MNGRMVTMLFLMGLAVASADPEVVPTADVEPAKGTYYPPVCKDKWNVTETFPFFDTAICGDTSDPKHNNVCSDFARAVQDGLTTFFHDNGCPDARVKVACTNIQCTTVEGETQAEVTLKAKATHVCDACIDALGGGIGGRQGNGRQGNGITKLCALMPAHCTDNKFHRTRN